MRSNHFRGDFKVAVLTAITVLLLAGMSFAQQQINLSAGPANTILPDGRTVPMWGYNCGALVSGSTATCAALNPAAAGGWSPVVITVPTGQDLTINLTNNLSFLPVSSTTPNNVPTSLVIVGQIGGGLGDASQRTTTTSPDHSNAQGTTTWPIAGGPGGTPPAQGQRVQSFATEVAAGATTATALTWKAPRPGTYLIESGTHPSIQGPMGLYGIVVVTSAPTVNATTGAETAAGTAYPGVNYSADVPLLFSEIDPVQNNAVNTAVNTAGFSETAVWSGQPGGCGNPSSTTYNTCYPPAVNYTALYYLINGVGFNRSNAGASLFSAAPSTAANPVSGSVLVRFVNAGLRMHVPSVVGSQTGAAAPGFSLIAEDGNPLPGVHRVQSEVFMAAGKTYDVMVNVPAAGASALPVYDRELSLSGNATERDAGMLAYVGINGSGVPSGVAPVVQATADTYNSVLPCSTAPCRTLTVSDPGKGLIANDVNVYGVKVSTSPSKGTLVLNIDGTFTYTPNSGWTAPDTFMYQANGTGPTALVTLNAAQLENASGIVMNNTSYTSNVATHLSIAPPGILSVDKDNAGYPLTVATSTGNAPVAGPGLTLSVDENGGFVASVAAPGIYNFTYKAQNSQGIVSANSATVTLTFPTPSNLQVAVVDAATKVPIGDYRYIIEEDRTFYIDPTKTTNNGNTIVPTFGTNFHTSYMPVVAEGCTGPLSCESGQTVVDPSTGNHVNAVCDVGNGVCRPDVTGSGQTAVDPKYVHLDPTKRYYISVLPGNAADPFEGGNVGNGMGGAPIAAGQTSVTVLSEATPLQPARLSVFVFEDDNPLNGEHDAGGGVDVLAPNEPGLGGFQIILADDAGGSGDATGQPTYDMFNMPLTNSLAGQIDPATGQDACPISQQATSDSTQKGIVGMIITCPTYESDGVTLSPLAGQAVINNLYPGRYGVIANPGADRIARGEEWLQTNTLDGQKAHDSFLKVGEPGYFQEYGPAGYHVAVGFANPNIINARLPQVCAATSCNNEVKGKVTTTRMSRIPDERLYSSGSRDSFSFTQCYVSIGDPDAADFALTKCDGDGNFDIKGLPPGNWRVTLFDQWNDQLVDGLSVPVALNGGKVADMGDVPMQQWQANIYTRTFFDQNGNGIPDKDASGNDLEQGLALVPTNIRFRDGSFSNFNNTDLYGYAGFNEIFPLFNWYVVETDSTRYKNTGTHVVYDAGGPADGSPACTSGSNAACGNSNIGQFLANTYESNPVPGNLHVPGAVYCNNADCSGQSIQNGPNTASTPNSTGRIDPPWVVSEAWQGFSGQNSFLEFGKKPFAVNENGGIRGHVVYASTRPFDDPQLLLQLSWEPQVPHVTINLYQEGTAADGSQSLKLVDSTQTSSWDDWAQGFRSDGVPNMNCPGQSTSDLFFYTLFNQPMYLNSGNLPNNSQYKCYDGMHNWNQLQPAPYDGMYQFPSVTARNPQSGAATSSCTICTANPTDGTPMLPAGKYVVEVVVPPGYELVKEEDKNILIGDNYIAPVTQQFAGLGNIFIIPDQAAVAAAYNKYNAQNPTQDLGVQPRHEGDTGSVESFWPCVGASRVVPDYISLFPQSAEVSPFAGATRNLCDRKEVTLEDQSSALAKFYIFSSTHVAAHYTGVITDDFTSEFDPFSPVFGEKFSPPNLPVSIKDFNGNEISRVYTDQWGVFNGLNYSTWEVNPPNPTGYAPTMMVTCMNDPGPIPDPAHPGQMMKDPLFNPTYSQFCYEIPFMPGQTQYMDTPVIPTAAFAGAGYNNPDCAYPDATPAVKEVDGDGVGPWVSAPGKTLTISALGDQQVANYGYSGPQATSNPFNLKNINRHFGFGSQCTSPSTGNATCNTLSTVTIGGINAPISSWSDSQIVVTVPNGVPACALQQQAQYSNGAGAAQCGELVITAGNGRLSVDAVTVTIGGKAPIHVTPSSGTVQAAIDAAAPGDLIMVDPGTYQEFLLMWKPVRLQGVGAASSILNANSNPAGRLDPWRQAVDCLFGLALNGQPSTGNNGPGGLGGGANPYDPGYDPSVPGSGVSCPGPNWNYFSGKASGLASVQQVDRIPLEGILGWDTTVNGNLAELLQEPSLMGAYEGAGITVLSKGVNIPAGADPFGIGNEAAYPPGTVPLNGTTDCTSGPSGSNPYPSNFRCNPSRIDALSITDSSQGGGGVFVHGWGHNLEIANNRIYNNAGTLSGGINVGQGEFPDAYLQGDTGNANPGSCMSNTAGPGISIVNPFLLPNQQLPYCIDTNVNVHNNAVTLNSSTGDELFSATPAGAGGVSFTTGSDFYKFTNNWVCGNMSTGDGGGLAHLGFMWNGDIEHNSILFNQSANPTIPTNGGGIVVMGAAPDAPTGTLTECGANTDVDCAPGLSDGTGPHLVINANFIQGNAAESGSGGGIRLQAVNGTEISTLTVGSTAPGMLLCATYDTCVWNSAKITNNIITDNVAGWDGGGISLQDAVAVNIINNTVVSNDSTASAGPLLTSPQASQASTPPPGGLTNSSSTASLPQVAGVVTMGHTPNLTASLAGLTVNCPIGHPNCASISNPILFNNIIWQNRSFNISVGGAGAGQLNQQNLVTLNPALNQTSTGACPSGANYWDIGLRGDTGPTNHNSGFSLNPVYSVLTSTVGYGITNSNSNPLAISQYCNGSRVPPENGGLGFQVPPGISDAVVPNPVFNLTPAATVDEGNNWVNISWGPLALTNPASTGVDGNFSAGSALGNYALQPNSTAVDHIPCNVNTSPCSNLAEQGAALGFGGAPTTDFFGNPRPDVSGNILNTTIDVGAIEYQTATAGPFGVVSPRALAFGNVTVNSISATQTLTISNVGPAALNGVSFTISASFARSTTAAGTCGAPPFNLNAAGTAGSSCTVGVVFRPTAAQGYTGSVTVTATNGPVGGSPVALSGTGVTAQITPASLSFGNVAINATSAAQTLTLQSSVALSGISVSFSNGAFARSAGGCGANLAAGGTCTIGVTFHPTAVGTVNGTVTINTTTAGVTITNNPVALSGTGYQVRVTPTSLNFANQAINTTSSAQSVTLQAGVAISGVSLGFSNATFAQPATNIAAAPGGAVENLARTTATITTTSAHGFTVGTTVVIAGVANAAFNGTFTVASVPSGTTFTVANTAPAASATSGGGTVTVTGLAAGGSWTFGVTFRPTTPGAVNATLTINATSPAGVVITGSPVSLSGTGALGALGTLDNFNRTTQNTLGNASWSQVVTAGVAAIHVQDLNLLGALSGVAACDNAQTSSNCLAGGAAYWNLAAFSNRQAARYTFSSLTVDGASLVLKATGGTATVPANYIQVSYSGGQIAVSTITAGGSTTAGVVQVNGAGFSINDTMTATVDATGLVTVWQNSNYLGSAQLPNVPTWTTGGGRIGMRLSAGNQVDNFAGGNF